MAKAISVFFEELGYPLRNRRWSWGARRDNSILLRTWQDEQDFHARTVTVLREPAAHLETDSFGLDERIVQLKSLWIGEAAGYTVIVEVKDKGARPRQIKGYREDVVFAINQIASRADGGIVGVLGEMVPIAKLHEHAQTHRTKPASGVFPVDDAARSGLSTDSYQQKLPAIRAWLISICAERGKVTYADVMNRFGLTFYPLRNAMSWLGHDCQRAGEPIITALIVDKETGLCSEGLEAEFGVVDDVAERERCYARWGHHDQAPGQATAPADPPRAQAADDLEERAARFALVEVRTQQPAFRAAVFRAFGGRCAISGCTVPEALEAAHLEGRSWKHGHNAATDGILLRRDLHALYDTGLLSFEDDMRVRLNPAVLQHYGAFEGVAVSAQIHPVNQNLP
ncbi:HNH endonuclease [Roseateles sp. DC23W]|uniref:HNH endonuclease n=1 Tax=Pelomonas dachongensis TaxID=3299029 RepID=A0ABW7EG75_9BURK